jgi:hypothetical protein
MSSPVAVRPSFGGRQRSSSRSRRGQHPASRPGSPTNSSVVTSPQLPLKSALKHNHVHPEPRSDYDELEQAACDPTFNEGDFKTPSSPVLAVASSIDVPPSKPFQRKVGFDTLISGRDLDDKGASTGGGTGQSLGPVEWGPSVRPIRPSARCTDACLHAGVNYSFTIGVKSGNFCRNRWTRTYLVATDLNGEGRASCHRPGIVELTCNSTP